MQVFETHPQPIVRSFRISVKVNEEAAVTVSVVDGQQMPSMDVSRTTLCVQTTPFSRMKIDSLLF